MNVFSGAAVLPSVGAAEPEDAGVSRLSPLPCAGVHGPSGGSSEAAEGAGNATAVAAVGKRIGGRDDDLPDRSPHF